MSNLPVQERRNQYTADGSTTVFNYTFLANYPNSVFPAICDVAVYVQPPGQVPNPPEQQIPFSSGLFTIQNVGNENGGTITFTTPPSSGSIVTLQGDAQPALNTEFANQINFDGQNLDDALQQLMIVMQQVITFQNNNCLQYPVNTYAPNPGINQLPPLPTFGDVWTGTGVNNMVTLTNINTNPQFEVFSGALASQLPLTPGTQLVGSYDTWTSSGMTLETFVNRFANQNNGTDGSGFVGYYNPNTDSPSTVRAALDTILSGGSGVTYLTDTSSAPNTLVCSLSGYMSYVKGDSFVVYPANSITGAATINIESLGAVSLIRDLGPLIANEMLQNVPYIITYNGTSFVVQNPTPASYCSSVYLSSPFNVNSGVITHILFNAVENDPNGIFNFTTHLFQPARSGTYLISYSFSNLNGSNYLSEGLIYKNGSIYKVTNTQSTSAGSSTAFSGGVYIHLNGSTDSCYIAISVGNSLSLSSLADTWANLTYIGP